MLNNLTEKNNLIIYFQMSTNNLIITLTDTNGKTLDWISSGRLNFKGRQKTSSAAVYTVTLSLIKKLILKKKFFFKYNF